MMDNWKKKAAGLFKAWSGEDVSNVGAIPGSGSYRRYYRVNGAKHTAVAVLNDDVKENMAFLSFTRSFLQAGFPVPEIIAVDKDMTAYLLQDLGDTTLFGFLANSARPDERLSDQVIRMYKEVIAWLPRFQAEGAAILDFSLCYPRAAFDRQSIMWDLNYFKYYFLKLAKIPFDEQKLEDDFIAFTDLLVESGQNWFMYRDFQSRNIMIHENRPWFIDYQGGRKGPLQYDIASLLYDAKADIPHDTRDELLMSYLDELEKLVPVNRKDFIHRYNSFVLVRIMQALGAYGFRGYYENKPHFLKSIPYAIRNLGFLLKNELIPSGLPVLKDILFQMTQDTRFIRPVSTHTNLVVSLFSFSYKKNIPADPGGNGGGFVFDCRGLPNPGKFEEYRCCNGKDQVVIDFLKKESDVDEFLNHVFALTDQSVKRYIGRDFTSLMITFGCTGGQHRSVYCAEQLAAHLREKFPVRVTVTHMELPLID